MRDHRIGGLSHGGGEWEHLGAALGGWLTRTWDLGQARPVGPGARVQTLHSEELFACVWMPQPQIQPPSAPPDCCSGATSQTWDMSVLRMDLAETLKVSWKPLGQRILGCRWLEHDLGGGCGLPEGMTRWSHGLNMWKGRMEEWVGPGSRR